MAAGYVQITILDGGGVSRNQTFYSSDGTITGNLTSTPTGIQLAAGSLSVALASDATLPALVAGSAIIGSVSSRTSKVAVSPTVTASAPVTATASFATNVMTVTVAGSGTFAVGQTITSAGVATGTTIASFGTYPSIPGTLNLSTSPGTIAAQAVSGAFTYAIGNEVGGLMTFASVFDAANSGLLQSIRVRSKSVQTTPFKLYLFSANPTNTTWTDKTVPALSAADLPNLIGVFPLTNPDSGLGTETTWQSDGISSAIVAGSAIIYGILVTSGTPTLPTTSDLTVELTTLKD